MLALEPLLQELCPHLVLTVEDVNSTLAAALVASKLCIPLAHVEAGLRSFDRTMPEEVNRIVTDALSDFLFTTERSANENLRREGILDHKIFFVGNVMIDTLHRHRERAEALGNRSDPPYAQGIREDMSIDHSLHSLFGVSKAAADLLVQEYGRYFGLRTACFRGGCLTGPNYSGTQLHGFLAYLMKCTLTGTPYTFWGYKGKQVRDNIHSADLFVLSTNFTKRLG